MRERESERERAREGARERGARERVSECDRQKDRMSQERYSVVEYSRSWRLAGELRVYTKQDLMRENAHLDLNGPCPFDCQCCVM